MDEYYIGIDPGANGAIMVLDYKGDYVDGNVYDEFRYDFLISQYSGRIGRLTIACVEDVHAMPGQGVTSMFSFGHNKGFIEGLLYAHGVPFRLVSPQKWKKYFGLSFPKGTDKNVIKQASIIKAIELFPKVSFKASDRCKKYHDGLCEAALMARYLYENDVQVPIPK